MTDILNTKEIVNRAIIGIPKGMKKCNFIFIAFSVDILVRNKNIDSEE